MAVSTYQQIRRVERLRSKLIASVKRRCAYEPHTIRCYYPAKRGFRFCPQHIKEILQVALVSKSREQALNDLRGNPPKG
jgi:hypothetical protein